jgi:hypothetical protein
MLFVIDAVLWAGDFFAGGDLYFLSPTHLGDMSGSLFQKVHES